LIFTSAQILRPLWSFGLTNSKWHAQGLEPDSNRYALAGVGARAKRARDCIRPHLLDNFVEA